MDHTDSNNPHYDEELLAAELELGDDGRSIAAEDASSIMLERCFSRTYEPTTGVSDRPAPIRYPS